MATHAISTPARAPHPTTTHHPRRPTVSPARRAYLSDLMHLAWSKFRFERGAVTFAEALRHAWAWTKGEAARAAAKARWDAAPDHRTVVMRSSTQSPVRRSLSGRVYANREAWDAGRLITWLGA